MKYIVISPTCCSEHGETEYRYYETLDEARKAAFEGDIIAKIIKEVL